MKEPVIVPGKMARLLLSNLAKFSMTCFAATGGASGTEYSPAHRKKQPQREPDDMPRSAQIFTIESDPEGDRANPSTCGG